MISFRERRIIERIRNVLIKVSGDVCDSPKFFTFTIEKAKENYVVVICGGGTEINETLKKGGYEINFGPHGRITRTWEERKIVRDVLERKEKELQDTLVGKGVVVIAPILSAGSVLCHINGDNLVKAYYHGFDEIYVFTLKGRIEDKKEVFKDYPKVQIMEG